MEYLVAPERIERPEFVLRSYQPGDGPLLFEAVDTSREHLRTWMNWEHLHSDVAASEETARRFRGEYLLSKNFLLGIFSTDEKRLLGGTGYHLRWGDLRSGNAEIGMWLRADVVYQGLGTKVLTALLDWGFTEWPWRKLYWLCNAENRPSARTAEKAGMRQEGLLRGGSLDSNPEKPCDLMIFGIMKDEWTISS